MRAWPLTLGDYSTPEELAAPWPDGSYVPVHFEHDMGPFPYVVQNPRAVCSACDRDRWLNQETTCKHNAQRNLFA